MEFTTVSNMFDENESRRNIFDPIRSGNFGTFPSCLVMLEILNCKLQLLETVATSII